MNEARIQRQLPSTNKVSLTQITKQKASHTALNVLLRTKVQVDGFAEAFRRKDFAGFEHLLNLVILDFEFGKDYAESVALIRELGLKSAIATTRILKPKEYHHLKTIIRCRPDMILVRNLGALQFLKEETEIPLIGDFSLNVTNSQTADYLIAKGLQTVNTSYDLNQEQLLDLLKNSDPAKTEVTLHQYMPEFHMEHCVFAAFLSKGHSFRDCGKPCERHEVKLKDPYGNWHHLKADQECRNTFFKATPQSASFLLETLKEQGVHSVRLEALNESPQELNHKIQVYLKLLAGSISAQSALDELKLMETYGLGAGQLNKADTYKDRKKTL
jgi:putative protease